MKDEGVRDLESSKWKEILSRFWIASFVNQLTKRKRSPSLARAIHVLVSFAVRSARFRRAN